MHRIRMNSCTADLSFRLSIDRALAALYKRRAEIEDLIVCLDSEASCVKKNGRFMNTGRQFQKKVRKKRISSFSATFQQLLLVDGKLPPIM